MPEQEQHHQEIPEEPAAEPDYHDLWLRAQAELENLRRRSEQERANLAKFGQASLLEELLPIVDNFERATKAVPEDQRASSWITGIQYIQKNLLDVLQGRGVTVLTARTGSEYDPQTQEALAAVPSDEIPEGHVVQVINNGYRLHDRLLRPIQVTVAESKQPTN